MHRTLLLLILTFPCSAQICTLDSQAKPEDPYAYMRTEVKALKFMHEAVDTAEKAKWPGLPSEPEYLHKAVAYYETLDVVDEKYICAQRLLERYKTSKNETVKSSVDSLLLVIELTKQINKQLRAMTDRINKAKNIEDLHQEEMAKEMAEVKGTWRLIHQTALMSVKMSTYGIVRGEGDDNNWKPLAFTITEAQHRVLLADVKALADAKTKNENYIDLCSELLLNTLNKPLPRAN